MQSLTHATRGWKLVAGLLVLGLVASWPLRLHAEETPRQLVATFMDALKAEDYAKALRMVGVAVPDEVAPRLGLALARQDFFQVRLKDYRIQEVKIDGGLALVTVEELRFFDLSSQARNELEQVAGPLADTIRWGDARVTETFVLVRLRGSWMFDTVHSGMQADDLPFGVFFGAARGVRVADDAFAKKMVALINETGVGRVVQTMGSMAAIMPMVLGELAAERHSVETGGSLLGCKSNLKNIGTALEMYCTDNAGRFPTTLHLLTPNYLRQIPTCPSAGRNTYSSAFRSASNPDAYTVICRGTHHKTAGQARNYPQYTSIQGLISQ